MKSERRAPPPPSRAARGATREPCAALTKATPLCAGVARLAAQANLMRDADTLCSVHSLTQKRARARSGARHRNLKNRPAATGFWCSRQRQQQRLDSTREQRPVAAAAVCAVDSMQFDPIRFDGDISDACGLAGGRRRFSVNARRHMEAREAKRAAQRWTDARQLALHRVASRPASQRTAPNRRSAAQRNATQPLVITSRQIISHNTSSSA